MRFGAFVPQGWRLDLAGRPRSEHWPLITAVADTIERSGFESLWVYDHFHTVPVPTQEPTYEAWTLMGALAARTSTVRLGQMCTSNSYRPPAYLAKVAATIDVISGGRLEMGIGAGWYEEEYLGYGYEFPRPSTRIGQLEEGVEIMRRMWTEEEVHYVGKYYQLAGAICQPKPVQRPHVPLWVAGGGEQLTLRVVARYGDYGNFGDTLDEFVHKRQILAEHCREISRNPDEITLSSNFNVVIGATEAKVAERLQWIHDHYAPIVPEKQLDRMDRLYRNGLVGTPEQIIEVLSKWRAAGLAYGICYFHDLGHTDEGLRLFAEQVIPALR